MVSVATQQTQGVGNYSWGIFFAFLFLYRSTFSVLGDLVVMRLTPISDTVHYQRGIFEQSQYWSSFGVESVVASGTTILSTGLTAALGGFFNVIFGGSPILINIAFQSIAFGGLVYLIRSIEGPEKIWAAVLVMSPSLTLWTSIASKEAIVVSALSIVSAYVIRLYNGTKQNVTLTLIAAAVVYVYKVHYLAALSYFIVVTWACRYFKQKAIVALVCGGISLIALSFVAQRVSELAETVQTAISIGAGGSTRAVLFFTNDYDFFLKAPEGIFLAFFGPRLEEVSNSPLHALSFIESSLLIAIMAYLVARRLKYLPVYNVVVGFFVLFWITLVNYPFGVVNPGSAVRYRSGWLVLVLVVVSTFLSRKLYVRWRDQQR